MKGSYIDQQEMRVGDLAQLLQTKASNPPVKLLEFRNNNRVKFPISAGKLVS